MLISNELKAYITETLKDGNLADFQVNGYPCWIEREHGGYRGFIMYLFYHGHDPYISVRTPVLSVTLDALEYLLKIVISSERFQT